MSNQIQMVQATKLVVAPENVRKSNPLVGQEQLKASLMAEGVLQNLIVYENGKGKFAVVGGERRRKAIMSLMAEKKLPKTYEVPCLVCLRDEAIGISLAENDVREQMHPADAFEAYAALIDQGKSIDDISARFGVSPLAVKRSLKLARVSPAIIADYREEKINLEAIMAFAVSDDHEEQEAAYKTLEDTNKEVSRTNILRLLTNDKMALPCAEMNFVGEEAYLHHGGTISKDLFSNKGEGYANESSLLERLVIEKLTADFVPNLLEQGWKWIVPSAQFSWHMASDFSKIRTKLREYTNEEEQHMATLQKRLDEIFEVHGEDGPEDGPDVLEYESIVDQMEVLDEAQQCFVPEEVKVAGGWVHLDVNGNPKFSLGYVKREDIKSLDQIRKARVSPEKEINHEDGYVESYDEIDHEKNGVEPDYLPESIMPSLRAVKTVAIQLEIIKNPKFAMKTLVHSLVSSIFYREPICLTVKPVETHIPAIDETHCPDDKELVEMKGRWNLRLPSDLSCLWDYIMAMDEDLLFELNALCVALIVNATHGKHDQYSKKPISSDMSRYEHANRIARGMNMDMCRYWQPTAENFFGKLSKAQIVRVVSDSLGENKAKSLENMKKPDMAKAAEDMMKGRGWLPDALITDIAA